jgi:hypothetical protein
MSRSIGSQLPSDLRTALDGERLDDRIGLTILLLTTDEGGWPCVALLSVGEVVAPTPSSVRLALWPGTTATRNLARSRKGTLALFGAGFATYVRIETERGDDLLVGGRHHAYFRATIADVLRDDVTYARMTSGVTFELPDAATVLARWKDTVAAMLAAGDGGGATVERPNSPDEA